MGNESGKLMEQLNIAVIIKLEPDFSEGNVSYNPDGTLNRAETKNTLGPHSAIAAHAAFFGKRSEEHTSELQSP